MAKKYLLYIHHSKFENETKKSGLVNELLDRHYSEMLGAVKEAEKRGDIIYKPNRIIKTSTDAIKQVFPKAERYCKHGYSIEARLCKFGCR